MQVALNIIFLANRVGNVPPHFRLITKFSFLITVWRLPLYCVQDGPSGLGGLIGASPLRLPWMHVCMYVVLKRDSFHIFFLRRFRTAHTKTHWSITGVNALAAYLLTALVHRRDVVREYGAYNERFLRPVRGLSMSMRKIMLFYASQLCR